MFDKLHKPKGYPFNSVDLGRVVTTDGEERVVAQIDTTEALEFIAELDVYYEFKPEDRKRLDEIARNCHGMIHIFAPSQVEVVETSTIDFGGHEHHDDCDHEEDYIVDVILNGRETTFAVFEDTKEITYEMIVSEAGYREDQVVTVTWYVRQVGAGGSLVRGQSVEWRDGMIINAVITGNA